MTKETERERWTRLTKEYMNTDFSKCNNQTVLMCAQKLTDYRDACMEVDEPTNEMLEYDLSLVLEQLINILKNNKMISTNLLKFRIIKSEPLGLYYISEENFCCAYLLRRDLTLGTITSITDLPSVLEDIEPQQLDILNTKLKNNIDSFIGGWFANMESAQQCIDKAMELKILEIIEE